MPGEARELGREEHGHDHEQLPAGEKPFRSAFVTEDPVRCECARKLVADGVQVLQPQQRHADMQGLDCRE